MSGLKQTTFGDAPVSFWTFDFDTVGSGFIIDEINNQNPMIVQSDINGDNYKFSTSLNELEPSAQQAVSIAEDGKTVFGYLNQYFEVPHTSSYDFPIRGEYTLEWIMQKEAPSTIRDEGEPGENAVIATPLFHKAGLISVVHDDTFNTTLFDDNITVLFLNTPSGAAVEFRYIKSATQPMYDVMLHCVASFTVVQTDVTTFVATCRFMVNGKIIGEEDITYFSGPPQSGINVPWLIAGNGGNVPRTDYATELLILDQIAVYNYGMSVEQAALHYRKTKFYKDLITSDFPKHYWTLEDINIFGDTSVSSFLTGGVGGTALGAVTKGVPGSQQITGSRSMSFGNGSSVYFENKSSGQFVELIDTSSDYTLEFWVNTGDSQRGLLFDSSQEDPATDWAGLRVFINSRDNDLYSGSIQVSESHSNYINTLPLDVLNERYDFNDNAWHHIVVRRSGIALSLIVDGITHNTVNYQLIGINEPGQVHLMNGRPGNFQVLGNMMHVVFYEYALQDQQIYNRYTFNNRYRVSGVTLLQGVPIEAQLRFYDSANGELMHQLTTDTLTGEYEYHPLDNRYLDVVSRLPFVTTARHRIHGPVLPGEFNDPHT